MAKFKSQYNFLTSVCFSPTGAIIAVGGKKGFIGLFVKSGRLVTKYKSQYNQFNSVNFSPDGSTLVTGSCKSIYLWDIQTG